MQILDEPPDSPFVTICDNASPSRPRQFGLAIDQALARWDLGHLREFELADGTRVVDDLEQAADFSGFVGPLLDKLLEQTEKVKAHVGVGDVFRYVFDFGDDWTCRFVSEFRRGKPAFVDLGQLRAADAAGDPRLAGFPWFAGSALTAVVNPTGLDASFVPVSVNRSWRGPQRNVRNRHEPCQPRLRL